ncbi:MAG: hypothetical protein AAF597_01170 [Bacteroidota bacterium]
MMTYTIDRTENEILIRLPISATSKTVQSALNFIKYVVLVKDSQITQEDVDELVQETKGRWWEENKERFRGVEGFEKFFE